MSAGAPEIVTRAESLFGPGAESRVTIPDDRVVHDRSFLARASPLIDATPRGYLGSDVCRFLNRLYYSGALLHHRRMGLTPTIAESG